MRKIFLIILSLCSFAAAAELPGGSAMGGELSLFPEGDLPELNVKELEELTKLFFPGEDEEKRKELIEETVKLDKKMRSMSKEERIAEQKKMEQELEQFLTQELAAIEEEQLPPLAEQKIPEMPKELPAPETDKEKAAKMPTASAQEIAAVKKILKGLLDDISQFRITVSSLPRISKEVRVEQQWQQTIAPLDEFESFATLISRKDHLLAILASPEFAMLKGQLTTLQQKIHSAISAVIVPDTFMTATVTDDEMARAGFVDKKTEQQTKAAIKTTVNNLFDAIVSQQLGWSLKRLLQKYAPEELKKIESTALKEKEKAGKAIVEVGPRAGRPYGYGFGGPARKPEGGGPSFDKGGGALAREAAKKAGGPSGGGTGGKSESVKPDGGEKKGEGKDQGVKKEDDKGKGKGKEDDKSKKEKEKFKYPAKQMEEFDKAIKEAAALVAEGNLGEIVASLDTVREHDIRQAGKTLSPLAIQLSGTLLPKTQKLQTEIAKAPEKEQIGLLREAYEKLSQAAPLQQLHQQIKKTLSVRHITPDNEAAKPIFEIDRTLPMISSLLLDEPAKEILQLREQARQVAARLETLPGKDRDALSPIIQQIMNLDPMKGAVKERAKIVKDVRAMFKDALAASQITPASQAAA